MNIRLYSAVVVVVGLLWTCLGNVAAARGWVSNSDAEFGFTFSYPPDLFHSVEGDEKPSFYYFRSSAADAKLLFGAWDNVKQQTPEAFKSWLIENAGGYKDVTYRPGGRSWFVLSGYRDEHIYYEKVMFSCAGRVVNVFAMSYPTNQRHVFDPLVERIEDSFGPGRNC